MLEILIVDGVHSKTSKYPSCYGTLRFSHTDLNIFINWHLSMRVTMHSIVLYENFDKLKLFYVDLLKFLKLPKTI